MEPIIANVSCHERMNRNMNDTIMNMKDLKNIDTFVDNPSWMTAVSEPILLTISYYINMSKNT